MDDKELRRLDIKLHIAIDESSDHDDLIYVERKLPMKDDEYIQKYSKHYECFRCREAEKPVCLPHYSTDIDRALAVAMHIAKLTNAHIYHLGMLMLVQTYALVPGWAATYLM